jgi:hypothetical protein
VIDGGVYADQRPQGCDCAIGAARNEQARAHRRAHGVDFPGALLAQGRVVLGVRP